MHRDTRRPIVLARSTIVPLALAGAALSSAGAQERLLHGPTWSVQPSFQYLRFADPLGDDTLRVSAASQLAIPVTVALPIGERWSFDVHGAYATGMVSLDGPTDGADGGTLALQGLTDLKLRLVGRLVGDRILVTLGLNVPTGTTKLDGEQTAAIRVLGAPALRFAAPTLGSGAGATAGVVVAREIGGSAVALGASYEARGSYTPIETALAGAPPTATELSPGGAMHFSLAVDRLAGPAHMSLQLTADLHARDELALRTPGDTERGEYRLRPAFGGAWRLAWASPRWRRVEAYVSDRYRAGFEDGAGTTVEGSAGNTLEAGVVGVRGGARGVGLVLGLDVRAQSGLALDNSIATTAGTLAGATVGLDVPLGGAAGARTLRPFVRGIVGRVDTGSGHSSATGIAVGVMLGGGR